MFTTVMNHVINEVTRHPTTGGGLSPASANTLGTGSTGRTTRSHEARRAAPTRWFRRTPKPAKPLPETYRVLANTFKVATGYF